MPMNARGDTSIGDPEDKGSASGSIQWIQTTELAYTVPQRRPEQLVCFHCGKNEVSLLRCAKCKVAAYCQRSCQIADWKRQHKAACASYVRANSLRSETDKAYSRDNILHHRLRLYVYPYAVHNYQTLGRGFLFLQSEETLVVMSLQADRDCKGQPLQRTVHVHYLTVGEYDHDVCRDDFEMAVVRNDLRSAVARYSPKQEVVVLMKFRCGHLALGIAQLSPEYSICRQLGAQYYSTVTAGSLSLNIDE